MAQKQHKRNPHAFAPIMKKGGVHEKTNKAKRQKEKMQWRKEAHNRGSFFWASIVRQLQRFSKSNITSTLRSEGSYIY
ncbi:hypothetical protein QWZ13_00370 [Reinekea marina]|uniref:Alternative ribosome-rescue factor n=1 Tax=Reinekea marina TaxID=1310421 RepID=A0ABV7WTH1_9GAMM|nr:hypothetical protein [Reinekea marina]MDN3647356.1 hypothetical protein [Reinekea marina]